MPWWSWILVWAGLVLVLLGVFVLLVLRLWRKAAGLQGELSRLAEILTELEERAARLVPEYRPRPNAVVRGMAEVERERRRLRAELDERRESRRRARLERATMITHADPMRYAHLAKRK